MQNNVVITYTTFSTKFGGCLVASTQHGICNILFFDRISDGLKDLRSRWPQVTLIKNELPLHQAVKKYFIDFKKTSKIKLDIHGTEFQKKVWQVLLAVPNGTTTSYGALARQVGDAKAARAVGAAVGANPIGYIIPCHRVLTSMGAIGGFRWGVERKRAMLSYEGVVSE